MQFINLLKIPIIVAFITVGYSCKKNNNNTTPIQTIAITSKKHHHPTSKNYYRSGRYNKCFECHDSIYVKYNPKKTFEDFSTELKIIEKANINYKSHPIAREYKTMITNGYNDSEVNFGGHYILVTWGCGSPCSSGAIVDVFNGNVFPIPTTAFGYSFRKNSTLLISDPPDERNYKYIFENYTTEVLEYIWNENTKKFIEIELE